LRTQVALRRSHCGASHYAIYDAPASACSSPTARPGTSMHEQGLAIDFAWHGTTLCYPRASCTPGQNAASDWLQAHAAAYGLHRLDTEAWHYSVNGR
jgi:LAS superfamily LD-carboxypeptidase LdcB